MLAIQFYDAVTAVHVMGVVAAFGVWFAWPLLPSGSAADHRALQGILRKVVTPAATVAFVAGIYLAADRDYFAEVWVTIPMLILIVLLGITGGFLTPKQDQLAHLAEAGDTAGYAALAQTVNKVVLGGALLVLVAIFLMVTKLGA